MEGCEDLETTSIQCWALSERFEYVVMILFELKTLRVLFVAVVSNFVFHWPLIRVIVVNVVSTSVVVWCQPLSMLCVDERHQ